MNGKGRCWWEASFQALSNFLTFPSANFRVMAIDSVTNDSDVFAMFFFVIAKVNAIVIEPNVPTGGE